MFEYISQFLDQFLNIHVAIVVGCLLVVIGIWLYYRRSGTTAVVASAVEPVKKPQVLLFHLSKCESLPIIQKLDTSKYNVDYVNCDTPSDPRIKEYNITSVPMIIVKDSDDKVRKFTKGMITLESVTQFITSPSEDPVELPAIKEEPSVESSGPVEEDAEPVAHVKDEDDLKIPDLNLTFDD